MGLFDRLAGSREVTLSSKSAILLACVTMVAADGDVDDDELAVIRRIDGTGSTAAWEAAVKVWKQHSATECTDFACKFVEPGHIEALIANLTDIAMADGQLAGAEKRLLEDYTTKLRVSESVISSIVDVIGLKNSVRTI
jgi:uncharacterized tellurite resistance protein B-like protein